MNTVGYPAAYPIMNSLELDRFVSMCSKFL